LLQIDNCRKQDDNNQQENSLFHHFPLLSGPLRQAVEIPELAAFTTQLT